VKDDAHNIEKWFQHFLAVLTQKFVDVVTAGFLFGLMRSSWHACLIADFSATQNVIGKIC
jgi:hypothetical protein